jgi:hypothetical protein
MKIQHTFPEMVESADANSRISEAEWYTESGESAHTPKWFTPNSGVLEIEPPLAGIAAAQLSLISGLPVYDMLFFVSMLAAVGVAIVFMLIFWKVFNKLWIGVLSGLLLAFPFEDHFNYLIDIGMYPHATQLVFLALCGLFIIEFFKNKDMRSFAGMTLMIIFAFYAHSPNAIFIAGFAGIMLICMSIREKFTKASIAYIIALPLLFLIFITPYLPVLLSNYFGLGIPEQQATFSQSIDTSKIFTNQAAGHAIQISNFVGILLYLLLIFGLISAFFLMKDHHFKILAWMFVFFFALVMVSSYFGLNHGHINDKPRYMLYIWAYPLAAMGIYTAILYLKQYTQINTQTMLIIATLIIIGFQINNYFHVPNSRPSILTQNTFNGFAWARQNVPDTSEILCVGCYQFDGIYTHKRTYLPAFETHQGVIEQLIDIAQNNVTNGLVTVERMGHVDYSIFWNGTKLSSYGNKQFPNRSICTFDYVIFKEWGQGTQLSAAIARRMASSNNTVSYNKDNFIVVKNEHLNGACI